MAGASDPLEDMLFSEVDEKAVSDLVGSLESQLVGQNNPVGPHSENRNAGSTGTANHHFGKTLPAQVGTTPEQQQQQGQHKAQMHQETNSKLISSEKIVTSSSLGSIPSFDAASTTSVTGVNASTGGLQSHGTSITTLSTSGVATLPSPLSISITGRGSVLGAGEASTNTNSPRKRIIRSTAAGIQQNLNGGAVTSRNNNTGGTQSLINNASTVASGASAVNSSRTVTASLNTTTFTLSNSAAQSAIALDRGTPTIALHRLPSHIVASIAQNGNGTTVSALVQQGARIGPVSSATTSQVNHNKGAPDTCTSKADSPAQSKTVMQNQSGVNSVINAASSPPPVISPAASHQQPSSVTTPVALTGMAKPAVSVVGQTITTTAGIVRPAAPLPSPVAATTLQPQLRPGVPAPQRIVAPQLIVRPPQQQTTIQLPPGFTIPPGMVLVRTEMGQLVMVPQQALAQAQAQAQAAQAQNSISPRPATPTAGATFRVTTPQSPVTTQAIRPCPPVQAKMVQSPTPPSPALQASSSSSFPAAPPKGPVAPAVAVTAPQQPPVVMAPQAQAQAQTQAAPQPALPPQTSAPAPPGVSLVSQV